MAKKNPTTDAYSVFLNPVHRRSKSLTVVSRTRPGEGKMNGFGSRIRTAAHHTKITTTSTMSCGATLAAMDRSRAIIPRPP